MARLCLSYRRDDSRAITGRIYDHLVAHFGTEMVFIDIDNIPAGIDFRTHIDSVLAAGDVLVPIIGTAWLGPRDTGPPRICEPTDPVRVEIQTALQRKMRFIPALVDGARMPAASDLPDDISEFAYRNAINIESGRDFGAHMTRLIQAAEETLGPGKASARPSPGLKGDTRASIQSLLTSVAAAIVAMLLAYYLLVFKLDTNLIGLQTATIVIALAFGMHLCLQVRARPISVASAACAVGLTTVIGMLAIVGVIDNKPFLPASVLEWQEAGEIVFLVILGTLGGYGAARLIILPLKTKFVRKRQLR